MILYFDTETYSETPIKHGTYRYVANSELMIATWAIDDGPVQTIDFTHGASVLLLPELERALALANEVIAHNAMFDRNVQRRHIPGAVVPITRWRCSMVKALVHALPDALDTLCAILQLPQDERKLKEGKQLVQLFCKPRPKTSKILRATATTHPAEWARFLDYARADVVSMRAVWRRLPSWNYKEAELANWHLDQKINDRGFMVDTEFAAAAIDAIDQEQARLANATYTSTTGDVGSATQRDELLAHVLEEYGVALPDLKMSTLERRINDNDLPRGLRELLTIRLAASSTSTSKYRSLVRAVCDDGRLRGTLQFSGAGRTRRWAGRTFQPQNLPRPDMDQPEIDFGIEAIRSNIGDLVIDDVMALTRNALRGVITAPAGRKLVVADLANIEGRVAAWLAGEDWKLAAFREYDAGTGPDLYKLAYARSFRIRPAEVNKSQRQVGKVQELMLQYQGGVGAFVTGAATYGIDLDELARTAWDAIPADIMAETLSFVEWYDKQGGKTHHGLTHEARVVCDAIKTMWRKQHPAISSLWPELEATMKDAIGNPGVTMPCRRFNIRCDGAWLRVGLPSGRALCYPQPGLVAGKVTFMGVNPYTKQWARLSTYGGKVFENACQSLAGDVLKSSMPAMDAAGYEINLTVHDEAVTETPDTDLFSAAGLAAIMSTVPSWATGLPLAAAGFECYRYRKE